MHTFDVNLKEITKVEGSASLFVRVKDNRVEQVQFKITETKRFFTESMKGKSIESIPQLLSRICGTCSNAHILASIEACERALSLDVSEQTKLLRLLTMYGLMIRDHALHLYLFALPDIFRKDAFLDFDEHDPVQHQLLHDGFAIKSAGNRLATLIAGRSVHAMFPTIGGFLNIPDPKTIPPMISQLRAIREPVLRLIDIFANAPFHFDRKTTFMALIPEQYGFLNGVISSDSGERIPENEFRRHLEHVVLPYSQASAYTHEGKSYMVGALARMNLAKHLLHPNAKKSVGTILERFPSTDIFHNNLAQAIEILHSIDHGIELLESSKFSKEPIQKFNPTENVGVGVIEAPRGTLFHKVEINKGGVVTGGEIVVPTGQNQINIEKDIQSLIESLLPNNDQETIVHEIEKLIRAYDPCMSCAAHFLTVSWNSKSS